MSSTGALHPDLVPATTQLHHGKLSLANPPVQAVLTDHPTNISALRLLADIGIRSGRYEDADNLLQRTLKLAPHYHLARNNYAVLLLRRKKLVEALAQADILLDHRPGNPRYLTLKGTILTRMGNHQRALELFEWVLQDRPLRGPTLLIYGHTLKTLGRIDQAVVAYRKAIRSGSSVGEGYWSLANLKTFCFSDDDIEAMHTAIAAKGIRGEERSYLAFALGKALEDRGKFDQSFEFYRRGNTLVGHRRYHDPEKISCNISRQVTTCSAEFFTARKGWGCPAGDPVFIVGLPRSGSTLLEQILASHSKVEGTAELPDVIAISRKLGDRQPGNPATRYPEILADLTPAKLRELGESYLHSTRIQRGGSPFFIDKMPNNFFHIGLIHLMLPNAKIIDARRHPIAGCFSAFKQLFPQGQSFSYNLTHLGRYYQNYVNMMDHWDTVLPGRVLRIQYEDMVAEPEVQIRRLLEYCELGFEARCLRFHETERAIRTPSSEQVRQPIYRQGLEQWRHYEAHLTPLKEALGPLLERYPI